MYVYLFVSGQENKDDRDAESRRNAAQALVDICLTVGVSPTADQTGLTVEQAHAVLQTLLSCLGTLL